MPSHTLRGATAAALAILLAGCTAGGPDGPIGAHTSAVERGWHDDGPFTHPSFYSVLTATVGADRAGGALYVPALDSSGVPRTFVLPSGNPVPLRHTCGVTFISHSFAVTAAHCVSKD